jgi:DNA-directed RNA polymerase sigma subunit (sigma70/sigma32)
VNDDPATLHVVAELRRHKDKIDRANQALILANLRLAIRVGKSLNGHEIGKLRQQLAAASDPGGLRSLEADDVWEILRYVASSTSRDPREVEHRAGVIDALSALTPRQERVVRLRLGIGFAADHTLAQIGGIFGLSIDRVVHLERSALWKLGATREVLDMDRYLCRERKVA